MKSNLQEELGRISELMSINEAPPRRKPKVNVGTVVKKGVGNVTSDVESSVQKSARRKKPLETEPINSKKVETENIINKKKKVILDDPEVQETLDTVLGPTLSKKARNEFQSMSDEAILKFVKSVEEGKFNKLPEVIQEKLNKIYKKDPTWKERWTKRTKEMSLKQQVLFWGTVIFGSTYVLGVLVEGGLVKLLKVMATPLEYVFSGAKSSVEEDWKKYVKDLDNYKVQTVDGEFVGTLNDVLKSSESINNQFYKTIQGKVDTWVEDNKNNYTPVTLITAMNDVLKVIIGDIDIQYNSSYYINPMLENDPLRPTLKNKGNEYYQKIKKSIVDSTNKLKQK